MKKETKRQILRVSLLILSFVGLFLVIYLPLKLTGLLDEINSIEKLKEIILSGGVFSYLIFFAFQFLQTTFIPIPAVVVTSAGAIIFGPWLGSLISYLAVLAGSLFAFFIGRKLGRKVVYKIIGEEESKKWLDKMARGKYVFFLMMLFPLFPDDILCLLAGITPMTYKFFIITNLITRPIAILMTSFLGSGSIIPFSGWGIPVWILLIIVAIIIFILTFKYQDKIENFVVNLGHKMSRKDISKNTQELEQNGNINDKELLEKNSKIENLTEEKEN